MIKSPLKVPVKFDLISDADLRSVFHGIFGDLEWTDFYRRYPAPGGFIALSRVGFNTEHIPRRWSMSEADADRIAETCIFPSWRRKLGREEGVKEAELGLADREPGGLIGNR